MKKINKKTNKDIGSNKSSKNILKSSNKKIVLYLMLSLFFIIGFLGVLFGITINSYIPQMIENTSVAIATGTQEESILGPILGILAKGHILNAPTWLIKTSSITGFIFCYISLYLIMQTRKNLKLSSILSKEYWINFRIGFYFGDKK